MRQPARYDPFVTSTLVDDEFVLEPLPVWLFVVVDVTWLSFVLVVVVVVFIVVAVLLPSPDCAVPPAPADGLREVAVPPEVAMAPVLSVAAIDPLPGATGVEPEPPVTVVAGLWAPAVDVLLVVPTDVRVESDG
jgi:predicted membrane metal-binding protein